MTKSMADIINALEEEGRAKYQEVFGFTTGLGQRANLVEEVSAVVLVGPKELKSRITVEDGKLFVFIYN
jgi:hypothetical protein